MLLKQSGKAPGFDKIHPEFLTPWGLNTRKSLARFFINILQTCIVPPEFKSAKIIAILKSGKSPDLPEIFGLFRYLASLTSYCRKSSIIGSARLLSNILPVEQAGFMPAGSWEDQVLALVTYIASGSEKCLKSGAVFIDFTPVC